MISQKLLKFLGFQIHVCDTKLTTTTYFAQFIATIGVLTGDLERTNKNHFRLSLEN
jgi:hypothetical protein